MSWLARPADCHYNGTTELPPLTRTANPVRKEFFAVDLLYEPTVYYKNGKLPY